MVNQKSALSKEFLDVRQYQLFDVWVVFFKLTDCYKMAPRLIHNRPGPVRCENAWDGPLRRSGGPARKRRLWVSRELKPTGSSSQRLSFWPW